MARKCQNGCGYACGGFVPWNGCGNTCGNTCANTCANGCTEAFRFDQNCPFQGSCPYPMTFEEMLQLLRTLRYGRLAVCVNGQSYVTPVCFSMRRCEDTPIFTLRLRTDGCIAGHLENGTQVTLQFDRVVNGGVCTVQAMGQAHVTGSTGCVSIVEVRTDSMMGECYRNQGCGNNCGSVCGNTCGNGCGNSCGNTCNTCENSCR